MPRKRFTSEQIIRKLSEAEVRLGQGESLPDVRRALAVSEQTFYRWRKEFGGLKLSQAQRLRGLERENELLTCLVTDLALVNQQLKDQAAKYA
jgi:putative transposase